MANHKSLRESDDMVKLWAYECMKVFKDRFNFCQRAGD